MLSTRPAGRSLRALLALAAVAALTSAAAAAPLVVAAAPLDLDGSEAAHPLAVARAEASLRRARHDYAVSRFEPCAGSLERAEQELAVNLRAADLPLLKRVNQWWGVCSLAGGARGVAAAAFARATRLPGPEPDPAVFAPALLEQYRAAQRPRPTCPWAESGALDGVTPVAGAAVETGEHYLIQEARSARVVLAASCAVSQMAAPAPAPLSAEEAGDPSFVAEVGRAAGVPRVLVVTAVDRTVTTTLVDVATAAVVERKEKAIPLGQTAGAVAREQVATPTLPAPTVREEMVPPPAAPERKPWYGRWWVWGAVAAVAAGATAALLASRPGTAPKPGERRYDVVF